MPMVTSALKTTDFSYSKINDNITTAEIIDNNVVLTEDIGMLLLKPQKPMLAKPVVDVKTINYEACVYEEKYDGERLLAVVVNNTKKKCYTRTLKESNAFKFNIILHKGHHNCVFDGELIYLNDNGDIVSFCDTGIRNSLKLQYRVFDVQMVDGRNVMYETLMERKRLLVECLMEDEHVKISKHYECLNEQTTMQAFNKVISNNGEGLMVKTKDETYIVDRRCWFKLKPLHIHHNKEEYDLYAYRIKPDKNNILNILECGYYDKDDRFVLVTNVSCGMNFSRRNMFRLLSDPATGLMKSRIIVTLSADKKTANGSLRHPSLLKIRTDLDQIDCTPFMMNK
jgi:ATP-dependent DNA ligase